MTLQLVGRSDVDFGGVIFSGEGNLEITVVLQQNNRTPTPAATQEPKPSLEPTKGAHASEQPIFDAYRRW